MRQTIVVAPFDPVIFITPKARGIGTGGSGVGKTVALALAGQAIPMTDTDRQVEELAISSLVFAALGPAERKRFFESGRERSWRAGASIFAMGDPGGAMMVVRSGTVRVTHPAPDGRNIVLADLRAGAILGEIALLDGGDRSAEASALTDCMLLVFQRRQFLDLLQGSWPATEAVLKLLCARLRRIDERLTDFAFLDLPARLAKVLIARARPGSGGASLRVGDTQGSLAAIVGGSRESVNRCLRRWEKQGLIEMADGWIRLLDPEKLGSAV